jgi:hypothetical protein
VKKEYGTRLIHVNYVETLIHLFLIYSFAKNCWASIEALVPSWLRAERATTYMRCCINQPFVMEVIITMCWCIWKKWNAWLFADEDPSVQHCNFRFKAEFALVIHRAKGQRADPISQWLENFPWVFYFVYYAFFVFVVPCRWNFLFILNIISRGRFSSYFIKQKLFNPLYVTEVHMPVT